MALSRQSVGSLSYPTILKVAQYLGVTVEYLLTGKDFQTLSEERSELVETTYKKKYETLKKSILKIAEEN